MKTKLKVDSYLRIKKDSPLATRLKAECYVPNPEYLNREKMGFSTVGIPRLDSLYIEQGDEILFPRGLVNRYIGNENYEIEDNTVMGDDVDFKSRIKLRTAPENQVDFFIKFYEGVKNSYGASAQAQCGFGKCVNIDTTYILTPDGYKKFKDLIPDGLEPNTAIPFEIDVVTSDGVRKTSHLYYAGVTDTIKVETEWHFSIEGTPEHPILVYDNVDNMFKYKKLCELTGSEQIPIYTGEVTGGREDVDVKLARLLAYTLTRGTTGENVGYIIYRLSKDYIDNIKEVSDLLNEFNIRHYVYRINKYKNRYDLKVRQSDCETLLQLLGLERKDRKEQEIPKWMMEANYKAKLAFIEVYFSMVGSYHKNFRMLLYRTANLKIAEQLKMLLLSVGIMVDTQPFSKNDRDYIMMEIDISNIRKLLKKTDMVNKSMMERFITELTDVDYRINVGDLKYDLIEKYPSLKDKIKITHHGNIKVSDIRELYFTYRIEEMKDLALMTLNYRLVNIQKIVKRKAEVADLTVPEVHNFIANGFVNHNTVVALNVIAELGKRAIVVVHKTFLVNQWVERIEQCFGISRDEIGIVSGDTIDWKDKKIVVALVQTLLAKDLPQEFYDYFGTFVLDEEHRFGAPTFRQIIGRFKARYRLGVTATPKRKDDLQDVFFKHIGNIVAVGEVRKIKAEVNIINSGLEIATEKPFMDYRKKISLVKVESFLVESDARNRKIAKLVIKAVQAGRKILVLSGRREHLVTLSKFINAECLKNDIKTTIGFYVGGMTEEELESSSKKQVILATYQMAQEGLDIPELDTLFLTTPKADIEQAVGRILRVAPDKRTPVVVDIVDNISICLGLASKRRKEYQRLGYILK